MTKRTLAIETSCDETALALLEYQKPLEARVIAEVVSSQADLHALYGGVVPELASRAHMQNLPLLLDQILSESKLSLDQIDFISVTQGPGLLGCLLMGVQFARGLAFPRQLPLVGVNHIEGHVLSCKLDNPELEFPYLCLVVSGGHTEIQLVHREGEYELTARTGDDAAGEAFDKSANLLGFEYPGGAKLAALADQASSSEFKLPRVMREAQGFSFSGLKTAISLLVSAHKDRLSTEPELKSSICFAVQEAIVDALVFKLKQAVKTHGVNRVGVCGGVSANRALRQAVSAISGVAAYFPKQNHSIDNAAMIGYAACFRYERGERLALDAKLYPRWPIEQINGGADAK